MDGEIIKTITSHACPSCGNALYIESVITVPGIGQVLSQADIAEAKDRARERLMEMSLPPTKNLGALAYLENETTIFGPSDIDLVLEQFQS